MGIGVNDFVLKQSYVLDDGGQQLIKSGAVETANGWLGQIRVDGRIVWESEPRDKKENALTEAHEKVTGTIANLFVS